MGKNSNDGTSTSLMYIVAVNAGNSTSIINMTAPVNYSLNVVKTAGGAFDVKYSMKDRGAVRMDVFNIKGGKVRTLVNASRDAGVYREKISTNGLAAGTYIVKMRAGRITLQRSILVLK
jgi:hypothetical protein